MKYKVGQKVRIISKAPTKLGKLNWAYGGMCFYCNKIVTITSLAGTYDGLPCYLTNSGGSWTWKEDWLLPASNFRLGDEVKIKVTGEVVKYLGILTGLDENLELISRKQLI